MTPEPVPFRYSAAGIAGERCPAPGPVTVLLHAGVADRRAWRGVLTRLAGRLDLIAYDRRGFGQTPPGSGPFRHLDDLLGLLDHLGVDSAWLAGNSAGGGLALDAAVAAPDRVAGLILLSPAVTGAPEPPQIDPATQRLGEMIGQARAAGDTGEVNRLETWLWLDGPAGPEGRVDGAARDLALRMNAICLANGVPEDAGRSGLDTWQRLDAVTAPATVACGDLDIPFISATCAELAARLPHGRYQPLPGMAHMPGIERPEPVADLIARAVGVRSAEDPDMK